MSKNYQKSVNHCGRRINYPRFGALEQDPRLQQMYPERRRMRIQTPARGLVPPPGTDVEQSPCMNYYASRNIKDIDENCMNCMYEVWDNDLNCTCKLDPNDICSYAKCVTDQYNNEKLCSDAYYALYNVDDVQDEIYRPPFTYADLQGCNPTN